jgi:hypothetical protein
LEGNFGQARAARDAMAPRGERAGKQNEGVADERRKGAALVGE